MTQTEFIKKYCEASKITEEKLNELGQFAVPCSCDGVNCQGWAVTCIESLEDRIRLSINTNFTHYMIADKV